MQTRTNSVSAASVLLVEDLPFNLDVATRLLEPTGCRVVTAENGVAAEALLTREKFDLVLMDCELPGLDGFEVTRRLRALERAAGTANGPGTPARTPVIALTAHAEDDIWQKCQEAEMDGILVKPFKRAEINQIFHRWVGGAQAPVAAQSEAAEAPRKSLAEQFSPASAAVDRAVLDEFLDSKGDAGILLVRHLLSRFSETASGIIDSLREKYRDRQPEEFWRLAHSMKSAAGSLGARQLCDRLTDIEKRAKKHGLDGLEPMLALLETDFAATIQYLQGLIGELDARGQ